MTSNRRGFLLRSAGATLAASTVSRAALAGLPELASRGNADTAPPLAPATGPHYNPVVTLNGWTLPWRMKDGVKEFLLVPYFGACIHTPPPPSNQIIDVLPTAAAKGLKSMDAVWISGTITTLKTDSYMGASGYRVEASAVEPYVERPR